MNHKKTSEQHKLTGTYRPDRHKQLPHEDGGIGPAPKHLGELAGLWSEIAADLPPGLGNRSDRHSFELLVRLVSKMRGGSFTASEAAQTRLLFDSFGLTPQGRQRLDIAPPEAPSPLDKFQRPGQRKP